MVVNKALFLGGYVALRGVPLDFHDDRYLISLPPPRKTEKNGKTNTEMSSKSGLWDFCIFTLLMLKVYGPYAPNGTGIFTYIAQKIKPNVGKYSLHGASGWYV